MVYSIEELKQAVSAAAKRYNLDTAKPAKIDSISLFGSYAEGRANSASDVDLLVSFDSAVVSLFTLADVLSSMEDALKVSVDLVQNPLPKDSLLTLKKVIPLYERV